MASGLEGTVEKAKVLLAEYPLCDWCLRRQFPGLKGRIGLMREGKPCYICHDLLPSLPKMVERVMEGLMGYEYNDFLVGATLSSDIIEREDELRAKFKLRGGEAVKSQTTREAGKMLSMKTGKPVNFLNPDVTVLMDLRSGNITITSRPVNVYGRYVKSMRGFPQKRRQCTKCRGRGCEECEYTGFLKGMSVEQMLSDELLKYFGGRRTKFTWVGGEGPQSLVLGKGRPFYAEVQDPKVRRLSVQKLLKGWGSEGIALKEVRMVSRRPDKCPDFTITASAHVEFEEAIKDGQLASLERAFNNATVTVLSTKKRKTFTKRVYSLSAKREGEKGALLTIRCDGGLSIKKFVSGNSGEVKEVTPSVSEVLGQPSVCTFFDVLDVEVAGPPK